MGCEKERGRERQGVRERDCTMEYWSQSSNIYFHLDSCFPSMANEAPLCPHETPPWSSSAGCTACRRCGLTPLSWCVACSPWRSRRTDLRETLKKRLNQPCNSSSAATHTSRGVSSALSVTGDEQRPGPLTQETLRVIMRKANAS